MKKMTPITEEHIVAWLDNELEANNDMLSTIDTTPELAKAASEFAALDRIVARTATDKRFALSSAVDSRVLASLKTEISRNRKAVRTPERAPNAKPIPSTVSSPDRVKRIWVRRTSLATVLALLLLSVWFGLPKHDEPTTASNTPATQTPSTPQVASNTTVATMPTTEAPTATNISEHTAVVSKPSVTVSNKNSNPIAANQTQQTVTPPQQNAPTENQATTTPADQTDHAAMMISHRYAKLIKATQAVVVSQEDRM